MRELKPDIEQRDYAKKKLTAAEIEEILDAAGGVENVLNTRHEISKERGWKANPPSRADFVAAAVEENNLLRRPIVIHGGKAVVGYDEDEIRALLD